MTKGDFIHHFLPAAQAAGKAFGINPSIILAQAAIESGWGQSTLAKVHNSFFGITAYGKPNPHWNGAKTDLSEGSRPSSLLFRTYTSAEESFLDFARLLHHAYPAAAALSFSPVTYAKEIAYSRYISEVNGDNRAAYQRMLVSICRSIDKLIVTQHENP